MALVDDIRVVKEALEAVKKETTALSRALAVLEPEVKRIADELAAVRRTLIWVGGLVIAGAISFSFSVLALVG